MNLGWQDTRYSNHDVLQDNSTLKKHTHPLSVNGKSSRQGATSSSYDSGSHHNTSATSDTLDSDDDVLPSERSPKVGLIEHRSVTSRHLSVFERLLWHQQWFHCCIRTLLLRGYCLLSKRRVKCIATFCLEPVERSSRGYDVIASELY